MKVQTKAYGLVDVDERQRIFFPKGLLGFENLREYILLDAAQQPFYWLQSRDVPEIAFVLISPSIFRPDYTPDVHETELEEIDLNSESGDDILVFTIVTIPEEHSKMTANLQGPVIINRKTRYARQCISINPEWKTKHLILEELAGVRKAPC